MAPFRWAAERGRGTFVEPVMVESPVPHRLTDRDVFLLRAEEARAQADAATLDNVRDRCLRAEEAWRKMAARVERTEKMRADLLAIKAAQ